MLAVGTQTTVRTGRMLLAGALQGSRRSNLVPPISQTRPLAVTQTGS